MAFEWFKLYKYEENIEREVTERVENYIFEYYDAEGYTDITPKQIEEIQAFMDQLSEYSPIRWGFNNFINYWEDATYEELKNGTDEVC